MLKRRRKRLSRQVRSALIGVELGEVMENIKLTAWVFITENARKENSIYSIELRRKGVS